MEGPDPAFPLLQALEHSGALRLNSTPDFPNVSDFGGTWAEVLALVTCGLAFWSTLLPGRTTYLSLELYAALRALASPRPAPPSPAAAEVLEAVDGQGPVSTDDLCLMLPLGRRQVHATLAQLTSRLAVTVAGSAQSLHPNWDAYLWVTRERWEETVCARRPLPSPDPGRARELVFARLGPWLRPGALAAVLRRLGAGR